mgnify:CR=1 FL=1
MSSRGLDTVCRYGMTRLYAAYIGFIIISVAFLVAGTGGVNSKNILEGIIEEVKFSFSIYSIFYSPNMKFQEKI